MSIFNVTPGNPGVDLTSTQDDESAKPVNVRVSGSVKEQDLNGQIDSADFAPAQNTVNPDGTPKDPTKKEEPMVILDGPLGRIYTQALNLVLANEDTGTMAAIIHAQAEAQGNAKPKQGTFVYAVDTKDLDNAALNGTWDWLRQFMADDAKADAENKKRVIISLESHDNTVHPKSGLIEELARSVGAEVYYTRESTLRAIKKSIKA